MHLGLFLKNTPIKTSNGKMITAEGRKIEPLAASIVTNQDSCCLAIAGTIA